MKLLYLHGLASGPSSKKAQFFAERFRQLGLPTFIPELDAGGFEHLTISGQLAVIDRAATGGPVALMGSSLGGYLAALYAARHSHVTKLVLLAPGFGFAQRWPARLGPERMRLWQQNGWMNMFHYASNRERRLHYGLITDGAQYEEYPNVSQPTLIFHGRHDDVVPAAWSEEFARNRPNVELHVEDSDHELLNITELMFARARSFLLG